MHKEKASMKKIVILTALFFFISSLQLDIVYSALNDFKKDVEKEESQQPKKSHSSSSSSTSTSSSSFSSSDNDEGSCGEAIGEIFLFAFIAWGVHNFQLRYNQYPYQFPDSNNFIFHISKANILSDPPDYTPNSDNNMTQMINTVQNKNENTSETPANEFAGLNKGTRYENKNYYFTLEGGGQYLFDDGAGAFAALRGKFYKLIGPDIEVKRIRDNKDDLDYYAFGLNIPICQFSGFMPDFYVQKVYLKGIIERDGWAYGIIINSYPVKPFSFMIRIGEQSYNNIKGKEYGNIDFMDYEGRVGVVLNRFEIFAGYRHLKAKYAELKGPVFGLKIYI
jgi:hypothetical protein